MQAVKVYFLWALAIAAVVPLDAHPQSQTTKGTVVEDILKDIAAIETHLPVKPPGTVPPFDVGDVSLYLYTQIQPLKPIKLVKDNWHYVNTSKKTKYIIHGWLESYDKELYIELKKHLLDNSDVNVIIVDWQNPAYQRYAVSATHALQVASIVAPLIVTYHGSTLEKVHFIGHSMGAHIAGFIGKIVAELMVNKKIPRITALDPSGPLFENPANPPLTRLAKTDADIVDVTHTDGGFFGYETPLGTADFYPNGGKRIQRGCTIKGPGDTLDCSHSRSIRYYTESITTRNFIAVKCLNWITYTSGSCRSQPRVLYGHNLPSTAFGTYFYSTNCLPPFAMGDSSSTDPC